jgi:hypothetical protein
VGSNVVRAAPANCGHRSARDRNARNVYSSVLYNADSVPMGGSEEPQKIELDPFLFPNLTSVEKAVLQH